MPPCSKTPKVHEARAPRVRARFASLLGATALAAVGCTPAVSPEPWEPVSTLRFRMSAVDGRVVEQEPPGGKHLVVFFAASDDLRSLAQIEMFERESRTFTNPPRCLVVAMDRPDAWPLVRLFADRLKPLCATVHAGDELRADGGPFAPVQWVPTAIVYDPLGHEVLRSPGGATGEAIAKAARAR